MVTELSPNILKKQIFWNKKTLFKINLNKITYLVVKKAIYNNFINCEIVWNYYFFFADKNQIFSPQRVSGLKLILFTNKFLRFSFSKQKKYSASKKNSFYYSRPLLDLTRYQAKHICKTWKLPFIPDKSNQFMFYTRNRIRRQILPFLRFYFNPKIDKMLFQFAELSVNEQFYINSITNQILSNYNNFFFYLQTKKIKFSTIKKQTIISFPLMFQHIILKKIFLKKNIFSINFSIIENFIFALEKKNDTFGPKRENAFKNLTKKGKTFPPVKRERRTRSKKKN